jgi:hypothetical protein
MTPGAGIDGRSSVDDVAEAFRRLGADARIDRADGGYACIVTAGADAPGVVLGHGATPEAAALDAWRRFDRRQGGTGVS